MGENLLEIQNEKIISPAEEPAPQEPVALPI